MKRDVVAIQSQHFFMRGLGRPPHQGEDAICLERNIRRPVSQVTITLDHITVPANGTNVHIEYPAKW